MTEKEIKKRFIEVVFLIEENKKSIQNINDINSKRNLYELQKQLNEEKRQLEWELLTDEEKQNRRKQYLEFLTRGAIRDGVPIEKQNKSFDFIIEIYELLDFIIFNTKGQNLDTLIDLRNKINERQYPRIDFGKIYLKDNLLNIYNKTDDSLIKEKIIALEKCLQYFQ